MLLISCSNRNDEKIALAEKHCAMDWQTMTISEKEKVLNEYLSNNGIDRPNAKPLENLSILAGSMLQKAVKYPETIIIDGDSFNRFVFFDRNERGIANVDEGILKFAKDFTAKNKLNMDVRSRMFLKIKYNAGCKPIEVIDFKIE